MAKTIKPNVPIVRQTECQNYRTITAIIVTRVSECLLGTFRTAAAVENLVEPLLSAFAAAEPDILMEILVSAG